MFNKLDKITKKIRDLRSEYETEKNKIILQNFSSLFDLITEIGFVKNSCDYYFYLRDKNHVYSFKFDFEEDKNEFFISWEDLKRHENWIIIRKEDNIKENLDLLISDIKTEYLNYKPYLRRLKLNKFSK